MKAAYLLLTILLAAAPAAAQPALRLTLDEAIRRGLESSHRVGEAVARGEAAQAVVGQRQAAERPVISAQGGYVRTNHVEVFGVLMPDNQLRVIYPDVPDNYRARLDLQWPIYTGGRTQALERAAVTEAAAASADVDGVRNDLRLEITRAYWALVIAIESQRVVDESLARIDAHLQDVRNQLDAGLLPPNEVLNVEAQRSRQRMQSVQARAFREMSEAELARLVGAAGTAVEPSEAAAGAIAALPELGTLVEEAQRRRPERAALARRIDSAEARLDAAAAGTKPTVGVSGGFDYARPNPRIFPRAEAWRRSWDAGVTATWPLFDGGLARGNVAEATASARALRQRLAEFDSLVLLEIRQRVSEIESARAAVAAGDDAVRAATESRRVVGERFSAGVATSTEVLDAQVALLQAELDRMQALANGRLAQARLDRAVGR